MSFLSPPPPTRTLRLPLMTPYSGNGLSKKCSGDLEKFQASPYVLGFGRISSFSMGLYRDLEKFRTLPLYIGCGTWKTLEFFYVPKPQEIWRKYEEIRRNTKKYEGNMKKYEEFEENLKKYGEIWRKYEGIWRNML